MDEGVPGRWLPILVGAVGIFFITLLVWSFPIAWRLDLGSLFVSSAAGMVVIGVVYLFAKDLV